MEMDQLPPRSLEAIQPLYPVLTGIGATLLGVIKLWWFDKKATKQRIAAVERISRHNDDELKRILEELKYLRSSHDRLLQLMVIHGPVQ